MDLNPHSHHPMVFILGRIVPAIMGVIGLSVCLFVWFGLSDQFGGPPLFFRVFGSLIGVVFMVVGFGGAIFGPGTIRRRSGLGRKSNPGEEGSGELGYACPSCGAGLHSEADVSPSGDAKCGFCDRWFNIHQAGS